MICSKNVTYKTFLINPKVLSVIKFWKFVSSEIILDFKVTNNLQICIKDSFFISVIIISYCQIIAFGIMLLSKLNYSVILWKHTTSYSILFFFGMNYCFETKICFRAKFEDRILRTDLGESRKSLMAKYLMIAIEKNSINRFRMLENFKE